jgi:hypothetical protein
LFIVGSFWLVACTEHTCNHRATVRKGQIITIFWKSDAQRRHNVTLNVTFNNRATVFQGAIANGTTIAYHASWQS